MGEGLNWQQMPPQTAMSRSATRFRMREIEPAGNSSKDPFGCPSGWKPMDKLRSEAFPPGKVQSMNTLSKTGTIRELQHGQPLKAEFPQLEKGQHSRRSAYACGPAMRSFAFPEGAVAEFRGGVSRFICCRARKSCRSPSIRAWAIDGREGSMPAAFRFLFKSETSSRSGRRSRFFTTETRCVKYGQAQRATLTKLTRDSK